MKRFDQFIFLFIPMSLVLTIFYSCVKEESQGMKVETIAPSRVMTRTAVAMGNIITLDREVEQHGHCWGTNENPTISGNKTENGPATNTGEFSSEITGLEAGTRYHIRAYLQNGNEVEYGKDLMFITPDGMVSLTTSEVTGITFNSASSGGSIDWVNGDTVLLRGVCWDTLATVNLIINSGYTENGSGTGRFSSELTDLIPDRIYFVKAYAITIEDTSYAIARGFSTPGGKGAISTRAPSSIADTTAVSGGNITYDGGSPIIQRGVCYGTNENPTIADSITINGSGTGTFTSSLSGLTPNTFYYVRAYATNAITTIYGEQRSFLSKGLPELTTANVTNYTNNNAACGGNIITDWGYPVTERGVCWSTSRNPVIANARTSDGDGSGSFTSSLYGLSQNTTYYVRSYATNNYGTAYGQEQTFFITETVEVVNPTTGRIWMDRNLGATRVSGSSDYYQWGRGNDGHQRQNSGTSSSLSDSDIPGHNLFIVPPSSSISDWRSPQNNDLWQGVNGINNPCPQGFRLPTEAEWMDERNSWSTLNYDGAVSSILRLTGSGYRVPRADYAYIEGHGNRGHYWSATVNGSYSRLLFFEYYGSGMISGSRAYGFSVRCIKD